MINIGWNVIVNSLIIWVSYRKKALNLSGSYAAFGTGVLFYWWGGWKIWTLLILFFLSSSLIKKIKGRLGIREYNEVAALNEEKNGRSAVQVFSNSLPALISIFFYWFTQEPFFYFGTIVGFAGAAADTWASEIGILSKKAPISIINGKKLPRGISGGISGLGTVSSAAGSLFISLISAFLVKVPLSVFVWIILFGFLCSVFDSILGALFQEAFLIDGTSSLVEKSDGTDQYIRIKGMRGFDNNRVNMVSNALTIFLFLLIFLR